MAGLWQRMLNTLFTSQEAKRRRRPAQRRGLKLEALENRSLMAANITGLVFTDANDDGTWQTTEALLGNVTVQLYQDGTDNTFNNGGGDDTLVGTFVTPTSGINQGRYSFTVNSVDRYFVVETTPSGQVQRPTQRVQIVDISSVTNTVVQSIDNFDNTVAVFNADPNGTNPNFARTGSLGAVLGGTQDLYATATTGFLSVTSASGVLGLGSGPGGTGSYILTYDGDTTNAAELLGSDLGTGTNNFDMTVGGSASSFRLSIAGESRPTTNATLTLRIRNASGIQTLATGIVVPERAVPTDPLIDLDIPFSTFPGGVDLTTVGAIQIEIVNDPEQQIVIDSIGLAGAPTTTTNIANLNPMTIGSQVFRDLNANGILNGGEPGIGGVTVRLYEDTNGNDILDPSELSAQPTPLSTTTSTTTGSIGQYSFTGLTPDDYIVVIPDSQFATSAALDNMTVSILPSSPPPNNANTGTLVTGLGVASAVTLFAGDAPVNDGDTDNNTDLSRDFGFAPPTITITKNDNPDIARVGDPLTYTLTVTNTSPQGSGRDSTSTVITDTLPIGLTPVGNQNFVVTNPNGTGGTATFDNGTRLFTANVGTLVPGQIATLTIIATVGSTFANPTTNTGNVTNAEGSTANSQISTPLAPNVDLGITKTIVSGTTLVSGVHNIGVGGALTYRLTITNTTNVAVTGVTVNDDLPTGFTPGTLPSGVTTGTAPADLVWNVGNLGANGTATVDIPVNVANTATTGPGIRNTVTIVTAGQTFTDSNPLNDTAFIDVTVNPRYELTVNKTNNLTTVATGQTFTYTMTARNDGPSSASNVTITDTLPNSLQILNSTGGIVSGQLFTANVGTLAANTTSSPVTVVVRVLPSATGANITNTASVTADNASTQERDANNNPLTSNNTATDTDPLTRTVTLGITKLDSIDPVTAGGAAFTYTVSAFNSGNADTSNVVITDVLPTGIELVDANNPGTFSVNDPTPRNGNLSYNAGTRTITANVGTLLAGGSATVNRAQFTLNVRAIGTAAAGQVTNTASVTDGGTPVTAQQTTTIQRVLDLAVDKETTATEAIAGNSLTYTIVVSHATGSLSTAEDILVTDTLPSTLTSPIVTTSAGTIQAFSNNNGVITGRLTSLAPGQTATVTVTATVVNGTPDNTEIINPVTISTAGDAGTDGNNRDSVSRTVQSLVSVSGRSYNDVNRNNVFDSGDLGIGGVTITLRGTGTLSSVSQTTQTANDGTYSFTGLQRGIYTITESQPASFTGTGANPGNQVGSTTPVGTEGTNALNGVDLSNGSTVANNFPNIPDFSKRSELASVRGRQVTDFTTVRRRR